MNQANRLFRTLAAAAQTNQRRRGLQADTKVTEIRHNNNIGVMECLSSLPSTGVPLLLGACDKTTTDD